MTKTDPQKAIARPAFRERLKEARIQRGLKQTDVARFCGLQPAYISQLEGGLRDPSLPVLDQWAEACGLRLELVGNVPPEPPLSEELEQLVGRLRALLPNIHPALVKTLQGMVTQWEEMSQNVTK